MTANMQNRFAMIEYEYNPDDGLGRLIDSDTSIRVVQNVDVASRYPTLALSGITLPCLMVDTAGTNAVYQCYDKTLEEHIQFLRSQGPPTVKLEFESHSGNLLSFWYLSPKYRKVLRGLIDTVTVAHSKDLSLTSLTLHDFAIKERHIIYKGGYAVASPSNKSIDLLRLSELIQHLFPEFQGQNRPTMLDTFMGGLFGDQSVDMENLLRVHLAILSPSMSLSFIRNLWDMKDIIEADWASNNLFLRAMSHMNVPGNWDAILCGDQCFYPLYTFYEQSKNIAKYKMNSCIGLLNCCRNMVEHLSSHIQITEEKPKLSMVMIETLIYSVYGKELIEIQKRLHEEDVLKEFMKVPRRDS